MVVNIQNYVHVDSTKGRGLEGQRIVGEEKKKILREMRP